jgi:outer membrane protein assembly factor BamE
VAPLSPLPRSLARRLRLPAVVVAALVAAGCATVDTYLPTLRSFGVYKLDINQGNYLSQDMVDKLRVGQTKPQVRQLLGTPLVVSPFRESRWDYVYEFTRQGQVVAHRTFTAYFVDDKLARWEGDEMPASMADLNREALARTSNEDRWGEQRSWWDSIIDIFRN